MTPTPLTPILTLKEVARHLRVHPSTLYRILKRGEMPFFKCGSDYRFRVDEIDRWRDGLGNGAGK